MEQHELELELNNVLLDVTKAQAKALSSFKVLLIAIITSFTLIVCAMVGGFFYYESQFETTETTTTTTTMETEGENANINNVTNGNQYNDEATHNE